MPGFALLLSHLLVAQAQSWPDEAFPLPWSSDGCVGGLAPEACEAAVQEAFAIWSRAGCTPVSGVRSDETVPYGETLLGGVAFQWTDELEPGVLAVTLWGHSGAGIEFAKVMWSTDVPFQTREQLLEGVCTDELDLTTTLATSLGQALGLETDCGGLPCDAPATQAEIMHRWLTPCRVLTEAGPRDIAQLEALYGVQSTLACSPSGDDPILGGAPLTLNCAVGGEAWIEAADWDFGDGSTASGTTVQHTWTEEGVYPVSANVRYTTDRCDQRGGQTTLTRPDYVRVCAPPEPEFELREVQGRRYELINRTPLRLAGCVDAVRWDIHRGRNTAGEPSATVDAWDFEHTFPSEGTWTVVLHVGGPGGTRAATTTVQVGTGSGCQSTSGGAPGGLAWLLLFASIGIRRGS